MRHGVSGRKLNMTTSRRLAVFRNMVTSLLEHERIFTTVPRAKELRRWSDWMITLAKRGDLHARRQAFTVIRDKGTVHKLFTELGPRYQNRQGGYTRLVKVGFRRGDASPMCIVELVVDAVAGKKKAPAPAPKEAAETTTPATEQTAEAAE